jgi:hypothetical protein
MPRILFFMPCWLSLWFFLAPLYALWATKSWVPVDAVVAYSEVLSKPTRRGTPPTRLVTHYGYTYQGKNYQGYRSGLDSVDTYGSTDAAWKQARVRPVGAHLTAYVNPNNPAHSLVFRELKWGGLGWSLGFALVWGVCWWAFFARRAQNDIAQERRQFVSIRMVVISNAIGWLGLAAVWPRLMNGWSAAWWAAIFPIAGLYLAYLRWQQTPEREAAARKLTNALPPQPAYYDAGALTSQPWGALTRANLSFAMLILFTLWWQFPRSFDGLAAEAARMVATPVDSLVQKSALEQYKRDVPSAASTFTLEDSSFAFVALGSGAISLGTQGFTVSSEGLRVQFRSDCPSALCAPIQSVQWMLVVPRDAAKPNGAWRSIAESTPQPIDFKPQSQNDQLVLPVQQIKLRVLGTGNMSQARLMVALRNSQNISTYASRSTSGRRSKRRVSLCLSPMRKARKNRCTPPCFMQTLCRCVSILHGVPIPTKPMRMVWAACT